jgi:acetyl-CoA carboxylase biotin carboxylase subunit
MKKAGVPMLPGSDGPVENEEKALKVAKDIGYPVIIKAVAGGGGRGMRVVAHPTSCRSCSARRCARRKRRSATATSTSRSTSRNPRHIEFQIIGDHHGNLIHLGERECSIQRRHQKLIEESPSPALTDKVRRKMGSLVVDAAKAVQYTNAGTFEFLMDGEGQVLLHGDQHASPGGASGHRDGHRHGYRQGADPDRAGERLSVKQSDVTFTGHSIECRINAEDPVTFCVPSPGLIPRVECARGPGVRIDTFAHSECTVLAVLRLDDREDHVHGAIARKRSPGCAGRWR